MRVEPGRRLRTKAVQRPVLAGRIRMANLIAMREPEFAAEIASIERDPLFLKLFNGARGLSRAVRRLPWPSSRFSGGWLGIGPQAVACEPPPPVEEFLSRRPELLRLLRGLGIEAFERYFIRAENLLPLEEVARRTGLSLAQVQAVNDLLLEIAVHAATRPSAAPPVPARHYSCLARVGWERGEPVLEFFSPLWARGRYRIDHDVLALWKSGGALTPGEQRFLPGLLRRLEAANMRQNTLYRVVDALVQEQAGFLRDGRPGSLQPLSLRSLSRSLGLSPSTVSRALCGRSIQLPWGAEAPLSRLVPGRREVARSILAGWLSDAGGRGTDACLAARLRAEHGILLSRRTVNAVRREIRLSAG